MGVLREALAENMRRQRRALGLSQEELAHRAEIDRTYVSSLERRIYGATIDMVERLAGALGVEPHELLLPVEGKAPARTPRPRSGTGQPVE